jgi:hypothetical protein
MDLIKTKVRLLGNANNAEMQKCRNAEMPTKYVN